MTAAVLPVAGSVWRNRKTGREARVRGICMTSLVEYRYRHAVAGRGRGLMCERTNTTAMGVTRFLAKFEQVAPIESDN